MEGRVSRFDDVMSEQATDPPLQHTEREVAVEHTHSAANISEKPQCHDVSSVQYNRSPRSLRHRSHKASPTHHTVRTAAATTATLEAL